MFNTALSRRQMLAGIGMGASAALLARPGWAIASTADAEAHWPAVTAYVQSVVSANKLPGALAAIGRGTGALEVIGRGRIAQGDTAAAVDENSLWRLYSQTKPVTGIAAMILIGEGKMKLDQPIADFLPAFADMKVQVTPDGALDDVRPAKTVITVRHLLTHTAGLGYHIVQKGPLKTAYEEQGLVPAQLSLLQLPGMPVVKTAPSLAEFADRLATLPLVYEPGTRWSYSVSLDLLGRVIEVASGMAFDAFLKARIFDPLGMNSTWFTVPGSEVGRLSTNYTPLGGALFPVDPASNSVYLKPPAFPFGGAGLVGSARDFDRFLGMLLGEGALGDVRIMDAAVARLAMSNLLPPGTDTSGTFVAGEGFGAGGRVSLPGSATGEGIFGWGGAAGTIAAVDRTRGVRMGGYIQIIPADSVPMHRELAKAIYADLAAGRGG
jgi:CubicO group peptidase (beta-lactamase class C family)